MDAEYTPRGRRRPTVPVIGDSNVEEQSRGERGTKRKTSENDGSEIASKKDRVELETYCVKKEVEIKKEVEDEDEKEAEEKKNEDWETSRVRQLTLELMEKTERVESLETQLLEEKQNHELETAEFRHKFQTEHVSMQLEQAQKRESEANERTKAATKQRDTANDHFSRACFKIGQMETQLKNAHDQINSLQEQQTIIMSKFGRAIEKTRELVRKMEENISRQKRVEKSSEEALKDLMERATALQRRDELTDADVVMEATDAVSFKVPSSVLLLEVDTAQESQDAPLTRQAVINRALKGQFE